MKRRYLTALVTAALLAARTAGAEGFAGLPTNAPAHLELRDQFQVLQKLSFPNTNLTLLAIADKPGSEQVADWVAPMKRRFAGRIDIRGLAVVSGVPGPLQGWVRSQFRKTQSYPVMMDWSGTAGKSFGYLPGKANLLVLDGRGRILRRFRGQANDRAIQELAGVIERALAEPQLNAAAH